MGQLVVGLEKEMEVRGRMLPILSLRTELPRCLGRLAVWAIHQISTNTSTRDNSTNMSPIEANYACSNRIARFQ